MAGEAAGWAVDAGGEEEGQAGGPLSTFAAGKGRTRVQKYYKFS